MELQVGSRGVRRRCCHYSIEEQKWMDGASGERLHGALATILNRGTSRATHKRR
jgi:hypothetical protein